MRLFYNVKFVLQAMAEWPVKKTKEDSRSENPPFQYPDPGSNRDGLLQRCLRPSRLPIPPSGHCGGCVCGAKVGIFIRSAK